MVQQVVADAPSWLETNDDVSYWLTPWLTRIDWPRGKPAYCKRCDAVTPMTVIQTSKGWMLLCEQQHTTHPVTVIVSRGAE